VKVLSRKPVESRALSLKTSLPGAHAPNMTYYEQQSQGPDCRLCRHLGKGKVVV
jgi:hypothetical protein